MSDPYFAAGYVRLLYRFVHARGVSAERLFLGTQFAEADLMQADIEMPFAVQMRLCENALVESGQDLGLHLGHQLQLAAHGPLGTAMHSAPDLQTALQTFAQFISVRASFFSLSMSMEGAKAVVTANIQQLPRSLIPFFSEAILFSLTHCLAYYTGQNHGLSNIRLSYADPGYGTNYRSVFGGVIEFEQSTTQILFPRPLLSLPSPEADAASFSESIKRCQTLLARTRASSDMAGDIETFLAENPGKLWTVDEVAPLFAVSTRTLIRNLKNQGTSYQGLRDKVLKSAAKRYLGSMSVEAAALALGFSDTSSFRRTFKRWHGVTPSAYLQFI